MSFFSRILAPPYFEGDREKTRHAQLLHIVTSLLILLLSGLVLFNIFFDIQFGRSINGVLLILLLLQCLTQVLIRRGFVRLVGIGLMLLSWLGITWIVLFVESLRFIALFAYFTIFVGAGFMFGGWSVGLFTAGSIFVLWVSAFYEVSGGVTPLDAPPVRDAIYMTALFMLVSLQIHFVLGTLRKSILESDHELNERLHVEHRLRNEQERLALALEASRMGTWTWDIETETVQWSDEIEAMFGMQKGEFDGRYETFLSLIHPDDFPSVQLAITRALSSLESDYIVEHRLIQSNGEVRWLEGRGTVYHDSQGKPVRMSGTVVNITDRKRADAEREQLIHELASKNAELEQFTYTVSHDLKAPIVTIKGFLGFVEQDASTGNQERLKRDLARISDAVDKMQRLLNELLELSRIGRMMNAPEPVHFGDLVREVLEVLQSRLQEKSLRIQVDEKFPVVYGDRRRILEVVQNLIDNAAKFMPNQPDALIEIGTCGYEKDLPVFFVRDNGIGIAPEYHERIFGLFNKLDPHVEGTGVGLALVKRVVEFHGGRIWVESESGAGTTFFFSLPTQLGAKG